MLPKSKQLAVSWFFCVWAFGKSLAYASVLVFGVLVFRVRVWVLGVWAFDEWAFAVWGFGTSVFSMCTLINNCCMEADPLHPLSFWHFLYLLDAELPAHFDF